MTRDRRPDGRPARIASALLFVLAAAALLVLEGFPVGGNAHPAAALASSSPYWAATAAQAQLQGHLTYSERPPAVQSIMARMYDTDANFQTLSALVVDRTPGSAGGSARIGIRQPDMVAATFYTSHDASGIPLEIMSGSAGRVKLGAPALGAYTMVAQAAAQLPPLASVPLGVLPVLSGFATIRGVRSGELAWISDLMVHPATFLLLPFFTEKTVSVVGTETLGGRQVWVLDGRTNPRAAPNPVLGDEWRASVDQGTGVILRLDYYKSGTLIGTDELAGLKVDAGTTTSDALAGYSNWFPGARLESLQSYTYAGP